MVGQVGGEFKVESFTYRMGCQRQEHAGHPPKRHVQDKINGGTRKAIVIASDLSYSGAWRSRKNETAVVIERLAWEGGLDKRRLPRRPRFIRRSFRRRSSSYGGTSAMTALRTPVLGKHNVKRRSERRG